MNVNRLSVDTDSPSVATDLLGRALGTGPLVALDGRNDFHFALDATIVEEARIGINRSDTGMVWDMHCPWDGIAVYVPMRRGLDLSLPSGRTALGRNEFAVVRKREVARVVTPSDGMFEILAVSPTALTERVEASALPDDFAVKGDLQSGSGPAVSRLALGAAALLACCASDALPMVLAQFEEAMTDLLASLLAVRLGSGKERLASPSNRQIAAARDFIAAHADQPLRLQDIARAAGLGPRALQQGFRAWHGSTPMAFLHEVRLSRCREDLIAGAGTVTVADIARKWGFAHLGRFSAYYRIAFGERPSDTVRRYAV